MTIEPQSRLFSNIGGLAIAGLCVLFSYVPHQHDSVLAQGILPPSAEDPPYPPLPSPLPPLEDIQAPTPTPLDIDPVDPPIQGTVVVEKFEFVGNTAFSSEELAKIIQSFTQRPLTYAELTEAANAITQLYIEQGYYTSGAYLPSQTVENGIVTLSILEGTLADIEISVEGRLNPNYVRNRLKLAAQTPLNVPRLLEALQLLQLDPVVENIQSELTRGTAPGTNILKVNVVTAKTFNFYATLDNGGVPSIGSFRRGARFSEGNLSGNGDRFNGSYRNSDGSNDVEINYTYPFNARNGTITIGYRYLPSWIIEEPLEQLDISSKYNKYLISIRQPIIQKPTQEFALGLTFDNQRNQTELGILRRGFPITPGADENGRTVLTTLRFFQEWTARNQKQVLAARSEFNFGINALGTTEPFDAEFNPDTPNTTYFIWRGQAQWARQFAPNTLLLVQSNIQVADRPIVPLEQFALGGVGSVLGYRQNLRLTDNGIFGGIEFRYPIWQNLEKEMVLQLAPFASIGAGWNSGREEIYPNTLASIGLGLIWQFQDNIRARFDFALPLTDLDIDKNTWQENGISFNIEMGF